MLPSAFSDVAVGVLVCCADGGGDVEGDSSGGGLLSPHTARLATRSGLSSASQSLRDVEDRARRMRVGMGLGPDAPFGGGGGFASDGVGRGDLLAGCSECLRDALQARVHASCVCADVCRIAVTVVCVCLRWQILATVTPVMIHAAHLSLESVARSGNGAAVSPVPVEVLMRPCHGSLAPVPVSLPSCCPD